MSMSQTDPSTPAADEQVDDNLIDAERQALAESQDEPDTSAKAADTPADPDPEPAPPAAEDRLGAAADKLAAAADALAARKDPEPEPAPATPAEPEPEPRNFASELEALKQQYDDGDIDMDAFIAKRDEIRDAQTDAKIEARLAADRKQREEEDLQRSQQNEQERWASATKTFFDDPANAALVDTPIKTGAFQAAIQEAGKLVAPGDFDAVLAKARELVGGAAPEAANEKVNEAKFDRARKQADPPATLRDMPNSSSHETPGAMLDAMDIDNLEDPVMQMTPEARDRWLASAPGGLGDNPRRGAD